MTMQPSHSMPTGLTLLTIAFGRATRLGVKTARGILDVQKAAKRFKSAAPATMDRLIRDGDRGLGDLVRKSLAKGAKALFLDEETIRFGPCVTSPGKIICVGLNYVRHAHEIGNPLPTHPVLFNKFSNALNSHRGTVRVSAVPAREFDYESELVMVIGEHTRDVSEADALSHVLGYCAGNDFTARDLQSRSSQWMIAKTCDGFGPIGPYLVTADQVNPDHLQIGTTVNGVVRQSSNTSDMIFSCGKIVSYISTLMTLDPGDIIFTGTPEGVIGGYPKEKQLWLEPGDAVTTTIEKLGTLSFTLG
jgi:2-keto-4-pentenoate hydratase/2-oxohepta-3-ene-1,7-dioic acid hydratase in catechol pathway